MRINRWSAILVATAAVSASAQALQHWNGFATASGQQIPVEVQISSPGKDGHITGGFINGREAEEASSGIQTGAHLVLYFSDYARKLEGDVSGSSFHGTLSGARMKAPIPVDLQPEVGGKPATHFVAATPVGTDQGTVNGMWEIAVNSSKGESAWTLQVMPFGGNGQIRAVIQRIDGDTGALYGGFDTAKGEYRVSRFGAFGRDYYAFKPQPDGTLAFSNLLANNDHSVARRTDAARAQKLAPPTLPTEQTSVADPSLPFQFSASNLAGVTIANTDSQFRNKVVIVAIGGSWCPNCHDEAPFLVELYNRFHAQGLEVVNLSFEEADQLKDPVRLREFITRYHIPYTVLVAGTPDDLAKVVPQGKNLNSWPTSFFIGRDGLVKEVHAGFSGPATGEANTKLKAEVTELVEKLLTAKQVASRSGSLITAGG